MSNNCSISLICCDPLNLEKDVEFLINKGFNQFHADFMDNTFVPRLGIYPEIIQRLKERFGDKIVIDSHLMIENPERCLDVIAPYSDWIFIHYESQKDPLRVIQAIKKKYNCRVGLAFNVLTSIPSELYYEDNLVDGIMLMGISPGVLGTNHYFDVVLKKLMEIRQVYTKTLPVYIDGSINFYTEQKYLEDSNLGRYTTLICGSSTIFKDVNNLELRYSQIENNLKKYEELLPRYLREENA